VIHRDNLVLLRGYWRSTSATWGRPWRGPRGPRPPPWP
jgi:hypothetical protein